MSEEPIESTTPRPGEVKVGEAVKPSGYTRSYIIRLIDKEHKVKGRKVTTEIGSYWLVDLDDLLRYRDLPHKTGPVGQTIKRKKKTQEQRDPKTEAAA